MYILDSVVRVDRYAALRAIDLSSGTPALVTLSDTFFSADAWHYPWGGGLAFDSASGTLFIGDDAAVYGVFPNALAPLSNVDFFLVAGVRGKYASVDGASALFGRSVALAFTGQTLFIADGCNMYTAAQARCPLGSYEGIRKITCSCAAGFYGCHKGPAKACPAGAFCPLNSLAPVLCSAGSFSPSVQAQSDVVCLSCAPSLYSVSGSTTCQYSSTSCPIGMAATPPAACTPCAVGFYFSASAASCASCPAGFFCPSIGLVHPIPCIPGTYSALAQSTSAALCITCPSSTPSSVSGSANFSSCF